VQGEPDIARMKAAYDEYLAEQEKFLVALGVKKPVEVSE
jgi:hypothetical protein